MLLVVAGRLGDRLLLATVDLRYVVKRLSIGRKLTFSLGKFLRLTIAEALDFVEGLDEFGVLFDFAFALADVDVAPEDEAASAAAACILPISLDCLPITPVPIPPVPNVLVAGHV